MGKKSRGLYCVSGLTLCPEALRTLRLCSPALRPPERDSKSSTNQQDEPRTDSSQGGEDDFKRKFEPEAWARSKNGRQKEAFWAALGSPRRTVVALAIGICAARIA